MRKTEITRTTRETDIRLCLDLDGSGRAQIETGIGFFDHMLTCFAVHSGFDLEVIVKGDLQVDCHHTVEDTGIVLGQALKELLQDKGGIARFGSFFVPMDEALAFCSLDISGRPYLVFDAEFSTPCMGTYETAMTEHFLRSVCDHAGITMHVKSLDGKIDHHKTEAIFKAVAHSLRLATAPRDGGVLSSKGML